MKKIICTNCKNKLNNKEELLDSIFIVRKTGSFGQAIVKGKTIRLDKCRKCI